MDSITFPAQIFVGLSIGILFLFVWTTLETRALNHLKTYSLPTQLILVFLVSGLPLVITVLLREVAALGSGNGEVLIYKRLLFYNGLLQGAGVSLLSGPVCFGPPSIARLLRQKSCRNNRQKLPYRYYDFRRLIAHDH